MLKDRYCFCELKKAVGNNAGYMKQWSYLPEKYARVGKVVGLKNRETGEWDEDWEVAFAGPARSYESVHARANDWKNQRKVSDV